MGCKFRNGVCARCGSKERGPSKLKEGFFSNMLGDAELAKLKGSHGYKYDVKKSGAYEANISSDDNKENFVVKVFKNGKPFERFMGSGTKGLSNALKQADHVMSSVQESSVERRKNLKLRERIDTMKFTIDDLKRNLRGTNDPEEMKHLQTAIQHYEEMLNDLRTGKLNLDEARRRKEHKIQ